MKKNIFTIMLLAPIMAMAQSLSQRGSSVETIVPEGWEHSEAVGDMNKDGRQDLVVIAIPNFKENMKTRDDGYVYNLNRPQLAIYFGDVSGDFVLFKKYDELIPAREEYMTVETSLDINAKGILRIGVSTFMTAGGATTGGPTYVFRYQDGDFFLIGKDQTELSRYSGETTDTSENYLTHKRQVTTGNAFRNSKVKEVTRWTNLPKEPLKRLGEFEM
jgi:hypothetical protein